MVAESRALDDHIARATPSLTSEQTQELARVVMCLIREFNPEHIYAFGSRARGDASPDSDADLMVVVPESDEPGHRRDQAAYGAVGWLQTLPIDILVWTRDEFDARVDAPSSLPAIVLRKGKLLYAA